MQLYNFYFKRSNGEEVLLLEKCSYEDAIKKMNQFLDEHNFTNYYTRFYEIDGVIHYDVGSWSEEFLLKECNRVEI